MKEGGMKPTNISVAVTKPMEKKIKKHSLVDNYKEFICGWGAAMINITTTFPINKLIFRQMLHGIGVRSAFIQITNEGFTSLYRGILPPLLQKSVTSSLMFGTYDMLRKPLNSNGLNQTFGNSIAAILSGSVEATLTPFERIQTLLQDSAHYKDFMNTKHAIRVIYTEYGFREYYRGLSPILLRNGPSNVVFFILREKADNYIPLTGSRYLTGIKHFLIGAVIGALNSTMFYPLNVIKVHMQIQLGGPYIPLIKAFKEVYNERERKISSFYKGVHMNYTRSFISWGVINLAYEHLKKVIVTSFED